MIKKIESYGDLTPRRLIYAWMRSAFASECYLSVSVGSTVYICDRAGAFRIYDRVDEAGNHHHGKGYWMWNGGENDD